MSTIVIKDLGSHFASHKLVEPMAEVFTLCSAHGGFVSVAKRCILAPVASYSLTLITFLTINGYKSGDGFVATLRKQRGPNGIPVGMARIQFGRGY